MRLRKKSYRNVIAIKPDYTEAHNNLGVTLQKLGQFEAAIKSYRNAIESNSNYADAHFNLGSVFQEQGKFDLATQQYNRTIKLHPLYSQFIIIGVLYYGRLGILRQHQKTI